MRCWKSPDPAVRRVGVYAGAAMVTSPLAQARPPGAATAAARWGANTSIRCCCDAPPRSEPKCFSRARYRSLPRTTVATSAPSWTRARGSPALSVRASSSPRMARGSPARCRRRTCAVPPAPRIFLRFKARFCDSALPRDLMPLLAFPGGYGGMVHADGGRVSLSCCIRRDQLAHCRQRWPRAKAGEAVLAHIVSSCKGAALALSAATNGRRLACRPGRCRPEFAPSASDGIFAVGNAAAEAHPIVAEGISMAIQSAALLCEQLVARPALRGELHPSHRELDALRIDYALAWRRNFSRRLHVAALFAHVFMRPASTRLASALLERFPQLLTEGARWSGKAEALRGGAASSARRDHERPRPAACCLLPEPEANRSIRGETSMTTLQSVQALLKANFDLAPEKSATGGEARRSRHRFAGRDRSAVRGRGCSSRSRCRPSPPRCKSR